MLWKRELLLSLILKKFQQLGFKLQSSINAYNTHKKGERCLSALTHNSDSESGKG